MRGESNIRDTKCIADVAEKDSWKQWQQSVKEKKIERWRNIYV